MNDDNEKAPASPNSAMAQLAAYRAERLKRSQIEDIDDEEDETTGLLQDKSTEQVANVPTIPINFSNDDYAPPDFGDISQEAKLISTTLNDSSSSDMPPSFE